MGLFGITLKKLEAIPGDIVGGVEHAFGGGSAPAKATPGKVNPGTAPASFNNGVYQSPAVQAANAVHAPAIAAPPPGLNPALNPPPNTSGKKNNKQDLFHNSVTNFLGTNVVKPVVQPFVQFGKAAAAVPEAVGREIQDKPINDIQQRVFGTTDQGKIAEKILGSTAGVGLTVGTLGLGSGAEAGAEDAASAAAKEAPSVLSKLKAPAIGAGFGGSAEMANGGDVKHVLEGAGAGGLLGVAGELAGPGFQAARAAGHDFLDHLPERPSIAPEIASQEPIQHASELPKPNTKPMTITTRPQTTDNGFVIPKGAGAETADAAKTISELYDEEGPKAMNVHSLLGMTIGRSKRFSVAGDQLEAAMEKEYTPEERLAARDNLEGVASPTGATPRVQALSHIMKQLNDKGYDALDAATPGGIHRVGQYATRLFKSLPQDQAGGVTDQLKSLFNVKSGFANNRVINKYIGSDGEVRYGNQADAGLTKNSRGQLTGDGKVFKPAFAPTKELEDNGYKYEQDYGKVANNYHSSVGRARMAQQAKDELVANPEHYGLSKEQLPGYEKITGIKELDGYYAPKKDAAELTDHFSPRSLSMGERAFQGITRGAIQSIVYNPLFHGRNLNELAGLAAGKAKGLFGAAQLKKSYVDLATMTEEDSAKLDDRMRNSGVHEEDYGSSRNTILTKAADQAGIPHVSKLTAVPMAKLDWNIRKALFHLVTNGDGALDDEHAAALVNHFLGDREATGQIARNLGLFWHYMKTRVGIVKDVVRHPDENAGTIASGAAQAAVLYGMTKAFQEWTGNQHASLGHPGIFGLANSAKDVIQGRGAAVATSTVNPLVTAAVNQLYGKDLYTGKTLSGTKDRLQNAEQTLVAPAQNVGKVTAGKASPGEEALRMLTGVSTPHVKGAPAVPNTNSPLAAINEKGATPTADEGKIHDPTGIKQASLYYNAKDKALKSVGKDPLATDTINAYLDDNVNAKGEKVKKGPEQSLGVANLLAETPDALKAMQTFQKSQPNHDPMWNLSAADLKTFLQYEGSRQETGEKDAMKILDSKFNGGEGLDKFIQDRSAYYNNNKFPAGSAKDNPDTPKYPSFTGAQGDDYNTYKTQFENSNDPKAKSAFIQAHPDVADALMQISKYYNADNVAQGGLAVKGDVQLTPAQQQWYDWYNGLPKGTGARSSAIKNNAAMWGSISNALAQSDLVSLAKQGAIDQYQGVPFSQKFLKDAYNAGKYDIAPNQPLEGGGTGFAVAPSAAYASSGGSGSGKSGKSSAKAYATLSKVLAGEKAASQARDAEHSAKADSNLIKGVERNAKLRGPKRLSVHMRGETDVKPYKVKGATLAARQVYNKPAKPVKALQRGNRAKLKA